MNPYCLLVSTILYLLYSSYGSSVVERGALFLRVRATSADDVSTTRRLESMVVVSEMSGE